ncbi:4-hydroxy-2-ketovalerate aldolase [Legionella israelensis]|uniref:Homocitrate synthase n=1 Tax=Legionella israelensis TaxID=454 RepID=A0A0W0V701_9GAMM|nr:4-hydroxy-2-oxovalerate aldolase [Legionella israelensis]KTD15870.1 4-hydroxy-2-oxovalerate aldolase [Legionella israelensis]SCY22717.1 4-hydroxy 2-oxovalerate aldolase [Legionella israelensis DSM 19235]STX58922.1 4-hydroxy-2-ketovalerate aldolase [Legionella israelensis]
MINTIQILDVSLRDGGHRNNFDFDKESLQIILTSLDKSGIEYIEVGYRNGYVPPVECLGVAGICARDYLLFCRSLIKNSSIAIMVHPQNVTRRDLRELKECGVDLLRICVAKGQHAEACPLIDMAKEMDLKVSVNLIHISHYQPEELEAVLELIHQHQPDMTYFADSNGSLFPHHIDSIYRTYTARYPMPFGFHAHDNLGLAQANALAAIEAGVKYIDVSLSGMGKGTGNLKTEFFTAYMHAMKNRKYKLQPILVAANYVREHLNIGHEPVEMDEFIRGISDLSTTRLKQLKEGGQYSNILPD